MQQLTRTLGCASDCAMRLSGTLDTADLTTICFDTTRQSVCFLLLRVSCPALTSLSIPGHSSLPSDFLPYRILRHCSGLGSVHLPGPWCQLTNHLSFRHPTSQLASPSARLHGSRSCPRWSCCCCHERRCGSQPPARVHAQHRMQCRTRRRPHYLASRPDISSVRPLYDRPQFTSVRLCRSSLSSRQ